MWFKQIFFYNYYIAFVLKFLMLQNAFMKKLKLTDETSGNCLIMFIG